ncbi:hypothetical protein [Helicobacter cetorum]|uniref:hypothetical protein n=1 Tax=Helicobacter cetorum TaxID=138563 RepID=UPI001315566C|nr:hypothetical protein [Helicobacter cetorum]
MVISRGANNAYNLASFYYFLFLVLEILGNFKQAFLRSFYFSKNRNGLKTH